LAFHNGKCVENNKFNYNFEDSETKPLEEVKRILNNDLSMVNYIVGQGISNDIQGLKKFGINFTKFEKMVGIYKGMVLLTLKIYLLDISLQNQLAYKKD